MKSLRLALMVLTLAAVGGFLAACGNESRNADPAGPSLDCGGYLGGGGGKANDSTGICIQAPPTSPDSL
jgi:hypothetical protein